MADRQVLNPCGACPTKSTYLPTYNSSQARVEAVSASAEMTWEVIEKAVNAAGEKVREIKAGGDKVAIDAAVAEMLKLKEELRPALEAAIAAETDPAAADALRAKLPPAPKSKADKKKESKDSSAADANKKAAEEAKAAARAKKKAEPKKPAEPKKASDDGADTKAPADTAASKALEPARAAAPDPVAASPALTASPALEGQVKASQTNKGLELHFVKEEPPLLALLASRLAKQDVTLKRVERKQLPPFASAMLLLPQGKGRLLGADTVARYFARTALPAPSLMYGTPNDALSASEVDAWIDMGRRALGDPSAATPAGMAPVLASFNHHLRMRTFFAGHATTLADAAVWIALRSHPLGAKAVGASTPHLLRWWKLMEGQPPMQSLAQDFFGVQKDAGSLEIDLPNAEMGKVVTRFPPEPSGHLHIGHVKAAMLNAHFAKQYKGTLLLRCALRWLLIVQY